MMNKKQKDKIISILLITVFFMALGISFLVMSKDKRTFDLKQKIGVVEKITTYKTAQTLYFLGDDTKFKAVGNFQKRLKQRGFNEIDLTTRPIFEIWYDQLENPYLIYQIKVGDELFLTKEESITSFESTAHFAMWSGWIVIVICVSAVIYVILFIKKTRLIEHDKKIKQAKVMRSLKSKN